MREYGFLMIGFDTPELIQELQNMIPNEELYVEDNDDFGFETSTHVTLVPCLDKNLDHNKLKKYLKKLSKYKLMLSNISKFENEKYDVLKCDANSDILKETNADICKNFPTHSEYKQYKPHVTIAYLKKGMADKYLQDIISPLLVLKPRCFMWSGCDKDGNDLNIEWT